jgi:hypothetical protein
MRLGIIGLPQAGKTTIFNALTRGHRPVGSPRVVGGGRFEVHTAVVPVPDPRVDALAAMFQPKKTTYAQVTYADIAGLEAEPPSGAGKSGFSGPLLNQLAAMDGLVHVVRAFDDPTVPHPSGSVNPERDVTAVDNELLLNDLIAVERKLERLDDELKKGNVRDRGQHAQETALFAKLQQALTADRPLRDVDLSPLEEKLLSSYGLLTRKPMLIVLNTGDDAGADAARLAYPHARSAVVALRGKLEMEIAQLRPEEAAEFLKEYGIAEPSLNRVIKLSYELLGLLSFFTVGEDEARAWTVRRGATAPEAAGEVHSDMQKGFIRAEVTRYEDLAALGGYAEVRAKGRLRLEGKEYVVQDGDVLNIRFSPPGK